MVSQCRDYCVTKKGPSVLLPKKTSRFLVIWVMLSYGNWTSSCNVVEMFRNLSESLPHEHKLCVGDSGQLLLWTEMPKLGGMKKGRVEPSLVD